MPTASSRLAASLAIALNGILIWARKPAVGPYDSRGFRQAQVEAPSRRRPPAAGRCWRRRARPSPGLCTGADRASSRCGGEEHAHVWNSNTEKPEDGEEKCPLVVGSTENLPKYSRRRENHYPQQDCLPRNCLPLARHNRVSSKHFP